MKSARILAFAGVTLLAGAARAQAPAPPAPAPATAAPTPAPPTAASLLAAAKQASGGAAWDRLTTTHDSGTATVGGLSGTFDNWLDVVHIKQASTYALGPATGANGWDGTTAWSVDSSGQVRRESSAEAVASAIEQAYFAAGTMFYPQRFPAEMVYVGTRAADGVTYQAVKVTPKGSDPVELWFDPATHLIMRMVEVTGTQPQTYLLSDYRDAAGVKLPFHTIVRTGGNPKFDQVSQVTKLDAGPVPDSRFAPPPPPAYDATFPAGKTSVTLPFALRNNHIYVNVAIDGKPATPFMFDTGATNVLDPSHAKALGLKAEGAMPGGGFGSQISSVGLVKVASVSLGGMGLHDQVFAAIDLAPFRNVEGADLGGLVGYEFAKRAVMTIDYAAGRITFTRPDAFKPPVGVAGVAFTFAGHIPMVEATIDGIPGQFEIDTGSRGSLTLMRPFAQAHDLVGTLHATVLATTGYGVGGPSKALLARPGSFAIGPVTLKQPVADLVQDALGAAAATHTAGNIGGDILKRFTLTLDYGHQKLYFQPNALAAQRDVFDRSGLWVNRADDGAIAVADVTANSAASQAGLAIGDEIKAVNGHDARTVELFDLREMFKGRPGTTMHLLVASNGKTRKVAIRLADQV